MRHDGKSTNARNGFIKSMRHDGKSTNARNGFIKTMRHDGKSINAPISKLLEWMDGWMDGLMEWMDGDVRDRHFVC